MKFERVSGSRSHLSHSQRLVFEAILSLLAVVDQQIVLDFRMVSLPSSSRNDDRRLLHSAFLLQRSSKDGVVKARPMTLIPGRYVGNELGKVLKECSTVLHPFHNEYETAVENRISTLHYLNAGSTARPLALILSSGKWKWEWRLK